MQTLNFPTSYTLSSSPNPPISQNPPLFRPISSKIFANSLYKGIEISLSRKTHLCCKKQEAENPNSFIVKDTDVATLGNLCVDIILNVPSLPPPSFDDRLAYMHKLSASQPDKKYWEAGGNCNMAIAAARIGLCCLTLGHLGNEIYGSFLRDVLHDEGIDMVGMGEDTDNHAGNASYETLLCWVLVDPLQRHGFCSRADFSKDPAFSWMSKLSGRAKIAIKQSKILFCNGYAFDDLSPSVLTSALEYASEVGTSVFFDPGPRGRILSTGTPEKQEALNKYLKMSNVILLTSDEAESLTGITNPILAGKELLKKGERTRWVIVKMGSKGSVLITTTSVSYAPAFKVNVADTVGCGDSFVAAIAFGYLHDFPTVNTLTLGNAVGAATAMGCGAGRNVATLGKVIEILKGSDMHDDDYFDMVFDENWDIPQVIRLTGTRSNGNSATVNHVSRQKAVSELLPKLEAVHDKRMELSSGRSMDVKCVSEGN